MDQLLEIKNEFDINKIKSTALVHLVNQYFLISIILFINIVLVYSSFDKKGMQY